MLSICWGWSRSSEEIPVGRPQLVSRAIAVRPTEAAYHATLAAAFWSLGQLDQCVAAYRSALKLQPDHPDYHCNLGATLIDLGAVDEATTHFREAIRLRPGFAAAHNNLANALRLWETGLPRSSISAMPCSSTLARPRPAATWASCCSNWASRQRPCTHCREAVRLRPDFPLARPSRQRSPGSGPSTGPGMLAPGHRHAQAGFTPSAELDNVVSPEPGWPPRRAGGLLEELGDLEQSERELRMASAA